MFATIISLVIPEPLRSVIPAVESIAGALFPIPSRDDNVTLVPAESAYMKNKFDPVIELPCPNPIHDMVDGTLI
jgi:hypothetical protein